MLPSSFSSPGPQPRAWCHPYLSWVLPSQPNVETAGRFVSSVILDLLRLTGLTKHTLSEMPAPESRAPPPAESVTHAHDLHLSQPATAVGTPRSARLTGSSSGALATVGTAITAVTTQPGHTVNVVRGTITDGARGHHANPVTATQQVSGPSIPFSHLPSSSCLHCPVSLLPRLPESPV